MLKLVALSLAKPGSACARMLAASSCSLQSRRTLIDDSFFGQDARAEQRKVYLEKLMSAGLTRETYLAKLNEQIAGQAAGVLHWADLNILLALAQTRSDVQLVHSMLKRLQARDKYGSVPKHVVSNMVRMLRALKLPDAALEFYHDSTLASAVGKRPLVLVALLDLIYESGKYDAVIDLFEAQRARDPEWRPYECLLLFAAACYRVGTAESFEKLLKVISEPLQTGRLNDKEFCLAALLAIKQKQPNLVSTWEQRLVNRETSSNVVIVRMLKALDVGDHSDLVSLLQLALANRLSVTAEVFNSITALIAKLKADTSESAQKVADQLSSTFKEISDAKLISFRTLEDRLLRPLHSKHAANATRNIEAAKNGYASTRRRDNAQPPTSQQTEVDVANPSRERTYQPGNERRQFPAGSPRAPAGSPRRTSSATQSANPWPYGAPYYQGQYLVPGWVVPHAYYGQPNWPAMQGAPVWPPFGPSNWPVTTYAYPPQPRWPVAGQGWFAAPRGQPNAPRGSAVPPQYGQPQPPYGTPRVRHGSANPVEQSGASVPPQDTEQPEKETILDPYASQPRRNRRRQRQFVGSTQDKQDFQAQTNAPKQTINKDDGDSRSG